MRFLRCCRAGRLGWVFLFLLLLLSEVQGDCGPPDNPSYASVKNGELKDRFPVGATVQYTCNPGYENIPGIVPSVQCLNTSEWSKTTFCQSRRCRPPTIDNGRIVSAGDLRLGDVVTFACDQGYRLIGQRSVRCIVSGNTQVDWNEEPPFCQIIPCFPPPNIINGHHSGDEGAKYSYGTAVTYKCDTGFSLIGNQTISCTIAGTGVDGKWSGPAPECKVVKCKRPEIQTGRVTNVFQATYTYENAIMIECDSGYTLNGSNIIKCGADELWHPAVECVKSVFTTTVRPGGDTKNETPGSGKVIGIAIGAVVAVIVVVAAVILVMNSKSRHKRGNIDLHPASSESYHVVISKDLPLETK